MPLHEFMAVERSGLWAPVHNHFSLLIASCLMSIIKREGS